MTLINAANVISKSIQQIKITLQSYLTIYKNLKVREYLIHLLIPSI